MASPNTVVVALVCCLMGSSFVSAQTATPTPTPAPFGAQTLSDPHLRGLQQQEFEFVGSPGNIYNLVTDNEDNDVTLVFNAQFGRAYSSGINVDKTTLQLKPYHAEGTWITAIGIKVGGAEIRIDTAQPEVECVVAGSCLLNGQVSVDEQLVSIVGQYEIDEDTLISLKNSHSFSRVSVASPQLTAMIDIVPPPAGWSIATQDISEYTHMNVLIERISLHTSKGVLGETSQLRYDEQGNPIMKAQGPNGEGLLRYGPEKYIVADLFEPLSDLYD